MKITPRLFSTTLFLAFFTWAATASAQDLPTTTETFDGGLGAFDEVRGLTENDNNARWENTNLAGGASAGEFGGTWNRTDDAGGHFIADTNIGDVSRLDALSVSGKFFIEANNNHDGWIEVGFTNLALTDTNPVSESQPFLGVSIIEPSGEAPNFRVFATSNTLLGGLERGSMPDDDTQRVPVGSVVTFSFEWIPDPVVLGNGEFRARFDWDGGGYDSSNFEISEPDATEWTFDAFKIGMGAAGSTELGRNTDIWFDDITYTVQSLSRTETFDTGLGGFTEVRGLTENDNNARWENTNLAGGASAGEFGGTWNRTDDAGGHFIADANIGDVSRLDPLSISGKFFIEANNNHDGWIEVGFTNLALTDTNPVSESQPFLGVSIIEPSGEAPNFRVFATSNTLLGGRERGSMPDDDTQRVPVGSVVTFSFEWIPDPVVLGNGEFRARFDWDGGGYDSSNFEISEPDATEWTFDSFKIGMGAAGSTELGRNADIWFDDINYTVGAGASAPKTVPIGELIDGEHVLVNNITAPLFNLLNSIPIPADNATYVLGDDLFNGTSGPTLNHDGTQVDPTVTVDILTSTIDDGINNNTITAQDDDNLTTVAGRRSGSPNDTPPCIACLPWETRNFGGQATFTSTNGDGVDFIMIETGGNDDLFVQPVLADGTLGTWVQLAVGDSDTWGFSGLLALDGSPGVGQDIVGLAWKVEDMLGADGNPLPEDAEILGLRFNDPEGAPGQEVDGGLDPSFLGAVIIKADATVPIGELIDGEHVLINNITAPLFIDLNLIPIPADNATYERDVDIFTGTSGPTLNHDGTQVDPSVTFELLSTTIDDGLNDNSLSGMDDWNINIGPGRRANTLPWETRMFGGQATFTSTNGNGVDFILFENAGNDELFVQAVLADGTVGQWTQLATGDGPEWGRSGLLRIGGTGAGQDLVGLAWKVEAMLGPNGAPLPGDAEILGLRFNDPAVPGQEVDGGVDPKLLVAVIMAAGADDPFGGTDLGGGWFESSWYGTYNTSTTPWFFHLQHDFQFPVAGAGAGEVFIYDLASEDWWWTSSTSYPSIYSFGRASWVFYFIDTAGPRNFVDLITNEFFDLP